MPEAQPPPRGLTPLQITTLERLLRAGFRFVTIERVERYLAVEKEGFVALLDPGEARIRIFGQVGYRVGQGIGMLIDGGEGKSFVWHGQSVPATPELFETYQRFRRELQELLERP